MRTTFQVGGKAGWRKPVADDLDDTQIQLRPDVSNQLVELAHRYGAGPFEILEVRTVKDQQQGHVGHHQWVGLKTLNEVPDFYSGALLAPA